MTEQILAGCHGARVALAKYGLQLEIQRVPGLFVPIQRIRAEHLRVGQGGFRGDDTIELALVFFRQGVASIPLEYDFTSLCQMKGMIN